MATRQQTSTTVDSSASGTGGKASWRQIGLPHLNGTTWATLRHLTHGNDGKDGHRLTEVRLVFKGETVLILMKKDSPKGPQVAFLEAYNLEDALEIMASGIKARNIPWKPDKWGSMRNDKG